MDEERKKRSKMALNDGDIVRITSKMEWVGSDIQNVWHVKYAGPVVSDAQAVTDISNSQNAIYSLINGRVNGAIQYTTIAVWNITQDRPMGEVSWPTLTAGAGIGQMSPVQCAPLTLFNTDVARSQGRKYWPPFSEGDIDGGGVLAAGAVSDLLSAIIAILIDAPVGGGVITYGNWNETLQRFAAWVTGVVVDFVKTQRRRYAGSGS